MTNKEKAEQLYDKAKKAYDDKDYNLAKEYYEKAIELNPDYAGAYNNLANLLTDNFKEHEKAKEYYEKAIELDPNFSYPYNNLANILTEHFEEHKKAKQYYEKTIELNPYYAYAYNNLALLLTEHFKEYKKAKQYYEKAVEINSNYAYAYNNLSRLIRDHFDKNKKRVTEINLKKYNQFKENQIIDFTYPKGHKKEGEPLDRICIIGQSGTGKSSLMKLIKSYFTGDSSEVPNADVNTATLKIKTYEEETKISLINFSPYVVESLKDLNSDDIIDYEFKDVQNILDFEKTDPKEHWYPIQKEITEYQKKVINKRLEFTKRLDKIKDVDKLQAEFTNYHSELEIWKKANKNPLKKLDEFLEPIFSKFYLKVNTEPSNLSDIKFIPIESISYDDSGEKTRADVQTEFLSTGTQQILARTVPLFALKPQNTVILIDEPENSLYPNMQKEFIDFITKESWNKEKTCQFFFATHSPTIASSFEPWEIIELQFNENGKVEQKKYYKSERNVDNYFIYPKYLRWDDIHIKLFNSKHEGDEERGKKIQELSILEGDIEAGVYKGEEKKMMIEKYRKLATQMNEI